MKSWIYFSLDLMGSGIYIKFPGVNQEVRAEAFNLYWLKIRVR